MEKKRRKAAEHREAPISYNPPNELFYYTQARQHGKCAAAVVRQELNTYLSLQIPGLLKEREYALGYINKIFAAQWLSDQQVVFGTKCNKIMVMNLLTGQMVQIPSLKSSDDSSPAENPCGIHAIDINPSRTMIATGGDSTNDLAVYRLPTFDPVCVGEDGHTDWIFDIKWLDDQFVVTGSRDNHIALWCIKDEDESSTTSRMQCLQVPEYEVTKPIVVRTCKKAEKVRALSVNENGREIASLSLNSYLHLWDAETFKQKLHRRLNCPRENVCMTINAEKSLYAVGSQSHVTFVDSRSMKNTNCISSLQRGSGVRSVSFREDVLTIGTGAGKVNFFDIRAGKYLELKCGHTCTLTMGDGWLNHDDTYRDYFVEMDYPNAIYSHCYDTTGTKLFTAGGPLPAGLWGNYAALWH